MGVDLMNTEEKLICVLLLGEADTKERVRYLAESYRNCPYINFMATKENQLFATYFLPERQKWWIKTIEEKPKETIGLEKAKVTIVEYVDYPEQMKMRLPKKLKNISPCGSKCETCPIYERCSGCPATIFFKRSS